MEVEVPKAKTTPETLPSGFSLYNRSIRPQTSSSDEIHIKRPHGIITVAIPFDPDRPDPKYRHKGAVWTEHKVKVVETTEDEDSELKGKEFFIYLR